MIYTEDCYIDHNTETETRNDQLIASYLRYRC